MHSLRWLNDRALHSFPGRPSSRAAHRPARRRRDRSAGVERLEQRLALAGNVTGFVYQDLDADNSYDANEGLSNWRVFIDTNGDGQLSSGELSATTSPSGFYQISNVPAGSTSVRTIVPTGWQSGLPAAGQRTVTVIDNQTTSSNNFQNLLTGALVTGMSWNDVDGNGVKGVSEPILSLPVYADLNLNGFRDSTEPSSNPAADGTFQLTLPAGVTAAIRPMQPNTTWTPTAPSAGFHTVTSTAGARISARDFGFLMPATVSGTVFQDDNGNGARDSSESTPLPGWTIYADLNGNESRDSGEPAAVTFSSGYYSLTIPAAGAPSVVTIRQVPLSGWQSTQANGGGFAFTVQSGANTGGRNFLNRTIGGRLEGLVWNDANGNGVRDSSEAPLAERTVYADLNNDATLSPGEPSTATRTDGTFLLTVLTEGMFPIRQVASSNWLQTSPAAGGGVSATITLGTQATLGSRTSGVNFGNRLTVGLITGSVFNDANSNGYRDGIEVGLAGWQVYADLNANNVLDADEPTATSSASGLFELYVPVPGGGTRTVNVRTQPQSGWSGTQQLGFPTSVTLAAGQTVAGRSYGFLQSVASVGGRLWLDLNGNGVRDQGVGNGTSFSESGASGTVYADLNGNAALDANEPRTFTGAEGVYQLPLPAAGTYTIRHALPTNTRQTAPANGAGHLVTVAVNDQLTGRDFGILPTVGSVNGRVFDDANANGSQDSGEVGVTGARVYADLNENGSFDTGEPSALTSTGGWYSFTVATEGTARTVTVRQQVPTGYEVLRPFGGQALVQVVSGRSVTRDVVLRSTAAAGAVVGGALWNDLDGDGVRESGEPPLSWWTVYVDTNNNGRTDSGEPTARTDADGAYTFLLSNPGTYTIRQGLVGGWVAGAPAGGAHTVQVDAASRMLDRDFGNRGTTGTVTGVVFDDANGNGTQDAGEAHLVGWRVYADLNDNQSLDAGEPSSMTSPSGSYYLSVATPAGSRTVALRQQLAAGWQPTSPTTGSQSVVVNGGLTATGKNFGNQPQTTITMVSGTIWNDLDADGIRDANERSLAGRMLYVDLNNNQAIDATEPRMVSSFDGGYQFVFTEVGTYTIRQTLPTGWVQTSPESAPQVVTVSQMGDRLSGRDFGSRLTSGFVSGTVFHDLDADGIPDSGEGGLNGWRVYADLDDDGQLDANEPSVTTSGGWYTLTVELASVSATVNVRTQVPEGWTATLPSLGRRTVQLSIGQTAYNQNFGNALSGAAFSGFAWNDANGDGVRNTGEAALAGSVIYADLDGDGVLDQGEPSVGSSADGSYQLVLPTLSASTYTIRQVERSGWLVTTPAGGGVSFTVTIGGRYTANFANRSTVGTVSGVVFQDGNANGTQDSGEIPLASWRVFADLDEDGVHDSDEPFGITSAAGTYALPVTTGVAARTVQIRSVVQDGWQATLPADGVQPVTVAGGQVVANRNFGYSSTRPFVTGTLWNDTDADGVRDNGEVPLSSWTVYADIDGDSVADADEPKAATRPDGSYRLLLPAAGTYAIRSLVPKGWAITSPNGGSHAATLNAGQTLSGIDFGARYTIGSVSGTVFDDSDDDGVRDAGESGLPGWRVFADLDDDGVLDTGEPVATTSSAGSYSLAGLTEGAVAVRIQASANWEQSAGGSNRLTVPVVGGQNAATQDFGRRVVSTAALITGTVFNDLNGNGLRDANETAASGRTVFADTDGDAVLDAGEISARTAVDGTYSLVVSSAGSYSLRQVLPSNWVQTTPASAGGISVTVATLGTRLQSNDFGTRFTIGSVSGTVFDDVNRSGVRDFNEVGLGGWRVYADLDDDGAFDVGEPASITSPSGSYFLSVPTGAGTLSAKVRTVVPAGWQATLPEGGVQAVTITGGQTVSGRNFANQLTGAFIAGVLWNDANGNGVRDAGEGALPQWTVYADADGDSVLDADEVRWITTGDGSYQLSLATAGSYTIRALPFAGWIMTGSASSGHAVTAVLGTRTTGKDFGARYTVGTVSGVVFSDLNGNGIQDAGEAAVAGWRVYVDANGNGTYDAGEATTFTSSTGAYSIQAAEGTVAVRLQIAAGWQATVPTGSQLDVGVVAGRTISGRNFGVRLTASSAG